MSDPINCKSEEDTAASKQISKNISDCSDRTARTSDSVEYYKWEPLNYFIADSESKHLNLIFKNCY